MLEAVLDLEDALSDRVVIHEDLGTNRSYTWALKVEGTEGAVDEAMANAAYTVSERYVQQRLIPMAMETRAVAAVPQPFGGDLTLYSATQIPHILKIMSAITLGIAEHQVRVDRAGGGWRLRLEAQRVRRGAAVHGARQAPRRPRALERVAHRERRSPPSTAAARSSTSTSPPTPTARLTALRVRLLADMGAYLQLVTPGIPLLGAFLYAGVYELPAAYDFECTSVFTTMTPTDAYRGAGRPEATYAIERAMDALAAQDRRRPARAAPAQLHPHRRVSRTPRGADWSTTPATTTPRRTRRFASPVTTAARRRATRTSTGPPSDSGSGCWARSRSSPSTPRGTP